MHRTVPSNTGVVHQNFDRSVLFLDLTECLFRRIGIRDIEPFRRNERTFAEIRRGMLITRIISYDKPTRIFQSGANGH